MRWIPVALLALVVSFVPAAAGVGEAQAGSTESTESTEDIVKGVESTYKGIESLRADFVQTTRSPAMGTEDKQKGKLHLKRPRKMRMEFTGADSKLVVTNGESIWIYSPSDKQVYVYKDLGGGAGMGVLLDDLDKLDEHFDVKVLDKQGGAEKRSYLLELVPREQAGFKKLHVEISRKKYTLERLVIIDQMDNQTELAFSQVKMNVAMPDSDFAFEAPKGTQVIEGM